MKKPKICYVNKEDFNQFVIEEYLKSIGYLGKSIISHLVDATSNVITKYDLVKNLNLLKELYQKREFERILAENSSDTVNIESSIEKTLQDLYELRNAMTNSNKRIKTMTDISLEYLSFIDNKEDGNRCDTGYSLLDSMLKGMFKGQLIGLAARPACGKSAFAMNIGLNVAKKGKNGRNVHARNGSI